MSFITPTPTEIKRANKWSIGHIAIDPDQPSITWMTRISMDATEVDRVTLSLAGRDIRAVEDLPQTLRKLCSILNKYAISKGTIPNTAVEQPDQPDPPPPPPEPLVTKNEEGQIIAITEDNDDI